MAKKFTAKHFDMDGVIFDSEPYHVEAEISTCVKSGINIERSEWSGFKGRTSFDIFTYIINNFGDPGKHTPEDLVEAKTEEFISIVEQRGINPIAGVAEYLQWCRSNFDHLALVTSSNKRVQTYLCQRIGITDIFDAITTGDDISRGKPAPDPYLLSIDRMGVRADQSVVTEDSESGIISAVRAGCSVLAIATSHTMDEIAGFATQPTFVSPDYENAQNTLQNVITSV